jgi:hypothetical protein
MSTIKKSSHEKVTKIPSKQELAKLAKNGIFGKPLEEAYNGASKFISVICSFNLNISIPDY